jgi:serine/threonine-protein kinase
MVSPGVTLGGRYRLDERIAGGGMGEVWRGTDEVLGRTVAIKTLLPALLQEPGFAERFRGEARTMATINHPGVVDVYDYGSEEGSAFLVMEYVEGDALSRTLSRVHRLTPARTMALIAQAADALHAAHEKGIVHRDVKPGNLLVRPNGSLVLTDFGIARSSAAAQLTAAGSVLGTASYISPEQAAGKTATPLSDVYGLGVVAYQCLAGKRPFEGDNPVEIAMRHVRDAPPPLPGDIPPAVRQVVEYALAKDPAGRYPSAAAMAQAARRAAQSVTVAGVASVSPATGGPTGPTRPISGGPVPRAFGGLVPGPAGGPPGPAGTRVMPRSSQPTTGAMPVQRQGQGQYIRGAAAVPAAGPATRPMGDHTQTAPAPVTAADRDERKGGAAPWLVLAVVIVLLFFVGGGWLLMRGNGGNNQASTPLPAPTTSPTADAAKAPTATAKPTRTRTTTAPPAPAAPQVQTNFLRCDDAVGKDARAVRKTLEGNNYTVNLVDRPGGRKGTVAEMSPCGEQPEGTVVTLHVFTGKDVKTPDPTESCGRSDGNNAPSCPPQG